jgi:hypothetical protein
MATSMTVSEDTFDRQSAAVADMRDAQQRLFEAAVEMSRAAVEATGQMIRSIVAAMLDLSERATATALHSAEQLVTMIPFGADGQPTTRDATSSRRSKEPAAA